MTARTLMVQGTASSVGKSLIVAALCRIFRDLGFRVAPFKSQNMALNSAVTPEGHEIGRAQAVQARAAGIEPTVHMNPILLKPETDMRAQVVLHGKPIGSMRFGEYHERRPRLVTAIEESLGVLRRSYDIVVIEGAGSPAEINLKDRDIVNGFIAELADAPVLLVGDIDRGGVFASLYGTVALLEEAERARIAGFVINKFRGDYDILAPALPMIESRLGLPVLGVVPFLRDLRLPEEDGMALSEWRSAAAAPDRLEIAVVALPHLSNFDDFLPLQRDSRMQVRWVETPRDILRADLAVLPGTKSTVRDLEWLRGAGLDRAIRARADLGMPVLGICGGCQMLGTRIEDPHRVETQAVHTEGLGLLPLRTRFETTKVTERVRATTAASCLSPAGVEIDGYFIHMGRVTRDAGNPAFERDGTGEGSVADSGVVIGTMIHGMFEAREMVDSLARSLFERAGLPDATPARLDPEGEYDRLARTVRDSLDFERVIEILGAATDPSDPDREATP
ncbi:MAG: cobyric acid synthase [Myxococcota bacterium]